MPITHAVATWRCRCGAYLKVVGELDTAAPLTQLFAACPKCGDEQRVYVQRILAVTEEDALEDLSDISN
jgi:hypothetical protein